MALPQQRAGSGLTLGELAELIQPAGPTLHGDPSVRVLGLHQDSRRVVPGDVFAARAGRQATGLAFVAEARARGAVAMLAERGSAAFESLPGLEASDVRLAIALAAEAIYGFPTRALGLAGITGTNGKTTTAWLAEHALSAIGGRAARLGTLGTSFLGETADGALTTPEADDISRYAAEVRARGATHLVMEVSSHALSLKRVEALTFDVAAFSNLTQDHLDFHGSMQDYAAVKAGLFTRLSPRCSVINVDDPYGRELARRATGRVIRVGHDSDAEIHPIEIEVGAHGIRDCSVARLHKSHRGHREPPSANTSSNARSGAGTGAERAACTAVFISCWIFSSRASSSAWSATSSVIASITMRSTGSRLYQLSCWSSVVACQARRISVRPVMSRLGSAPALPGHTAVRVSRKNGPPPERTRSIAPAAASNTLVTSVASTVADSMR